MPLIGPASAKVVVPIAGNHSGIPEVLADARYLCSTPNPEEISGEQ